MTLKNDELILVSFFRFEFSGNRSDKILLLWDISPIFSTEMYRCVGGMPVPVFTVEKASSTLKMKVVNCRTSNIRKPSYLNTARIIIRTDSNTALT
jgi:hypothetical protein